MTLPKVPAQELQLFTDYCDAAGYNVVSGRTVGDTRKWKIRSQGEDRGVAVLFYSDREKDWTLDVYSPEEHHKTKLGEMLQKSRVEIPTL